MLNAVKEDSSDGVKGEAGKFSFVCMVIKLKIDGQVSGFKQTNYGPIGVRVKLTHCYNFREGTRPYVGFFF